MAEKCEKCAGYGSFWTNTGKKRAPKPRPDKNRVHVQLKGTIDLVLVEGVWR